MYCRKINLAHVSCWCHKVIDKEQLMRVLLVPATANQNVYNASILRTIEFKGTWKSKKNKKARIWIQSIVFNRNRPECCRLGTVNKIKQVGFAASVARRDRGSRRDWIGRLSYRGGSEQLKGMDPVFDLIRGTCTCRLLLERRVRLDTDSFNRSHRYVDCFVVKVLKVSRLILNWILKLTGNQWRDLRILGNMRFPGQNPGQKSLHLLKSLDVLVWKAVEKIVAVVKPTAYESCCQGFCTTQANMFSDVMQILDVMKPCPERSERLGLNSGRSWLQGSLSTLMFPCSPLGSKRQGKQWHVLIALLFTTNEEKLRFSWVKFRLIPKHPVLNRVDTLLGTEKCGWRVSGREELRSEISYTRTEGTAGIGSLDVVLDPLNQNFLVVFRDEAYVLDREIDFSCLLLAGRASS